MRLKQARCDAFGALLQVNVVDFGGISLGHRAYAVSPTARLQLTTQSLLLVDTYNCTSINLQALSVE